MHMFATTGERVLVIGTGGALGALTATAFEHAGWEVVRASRAAPVGSASTAPEGRHIDLDDPDTIAPAAAGVDVIVNPVPHPALHLERHALEHGGVVLNSSAISTEHTAGLGRPDAKPKGTVVTGAGIAPGLTNLVAAQLLAEHRDADELEIVFTFSAAATAGPAGLQFVHRHLTASPWHETTVVPLESPFGARECIGFAEGERGWLGTFADGKKVGLYACFHESPAQEALLARNRRGTITALSPPLPVRRDNGTSKEPVAHWIAVKRRGRRLAARSIRCAGDYRGAAHATLALAQALQDARARGQLAAGAFAPEDLVDVAQLAPYLATAGVAIVTSAV
ncbi:MAG TPA: hypothetical protein VGI87_02270 [Solirubrobacteraceae bacterium]|jgi:hypothetical protein